MSQEPSASSFSVKPEVVFLEELFDEIKRGQLRSPRFQRPFIWSAEDMRKLFESVIKGYPIGSLLIWEPGERYQCLPRFGPIAQEEPAEDRKDLAYILDGQHRLATLFGTTHVHGDPPEQSAERVWWMWYDLDEEEFTHTPRGVVGAHHLPLRQMLRTTDFLQFCTRLLKERPTDGGTLIARAERVARLIRGFRVPVVRIRGGRLEDASEIFSRLNSSGKPMAADQMVSALTYREGEGAFDLSSRITQILERLGDLHFSGVDRSAVLRALAGIAGIKIHSKPGAQVANFLLSEAFTPTGREELVERTRTGLVNATQWLVDDIGVLCDHLLPYAMQLVLLAQFYCRRDPTPREAETLRRWFFSTSFAGWFAGGNTTQINDDLAEMAAFERGVVQSFASLNERAKPFPERFDLRAARVRAFLLATLLPAKPLHRRGQPVDVVTIFTGDDAASVPKVFAPRESSPLASTPANRILLPSLDRKGARQQLLDLPIEERDEVLRSHCIDEAAWNALLANDLESFVRARTAHLIAIERAFMATLGIAAPERETDEAVLDAGG
jgi:Protein of unknown function DUF262